MQLEELEIAEWGNCIGTRLKSNQKKHGIVRTIWTGGFYDETYVEGVQEGISVGFVYGVVSVYYFENGEQQSYFRFKPLDGFKESGREGEKLSHLTAETFDPTFDSQEPEQNTYKPSQIVREAEVVAFSARITNTEEDNLKQSERITALEKFREAHRSQGVVGRLFGKK